MEQYIDTLKSYLNINKYIAKSVCYGASNIFPSNLGFDACNAVQGNTVNILVI